MKIKNKNEIIYPELSYKMCGLCFEAHNKLGRYLNEKQYCDYLERLFTENNLNFVREAPLPVSFPNEKERRNIPDFIIEDTLILDIKAKFIVTKQDYFQMQRYLNSANKKLGLIVNFRRKYLVPKRVLNKNFKLDEVEEKVNFITNIKKYFRHS